MADVSRRSGDGQGRADRGQLILVTGLLVAVTMVTIVLLLNTAIFTENLASRGVDQSGREAIEYRGVLDDGVVRLVEAENEREWGSWATLHDTTRDGVLRMDNFTARSYATRGQVAGINHSTLTVHEGKVVGQNDSSRQFLDESGTGILSWELATDIPGTRRYAMTVNNDATLKSTNESNAVTDLAFNVQISETGGTDTWNAYVYENQSTSEVALATTTGATLTEHCSASGSAVTINLTAGTMAGSPCSGYIWAEGIDGAYRIEYANGDNVTGTYNMTVNVSGSGSVNTLNLNSGGPSPYHKPAVYSVTFDVFYETPTLAYRAPVRVAPGEPE